MIVALVVVVVLLFVLELKTSRPDGTYLKRVPAYRKMLHYIMPSRNESVVYFDRAARADKLLEYLPLAKEKLGADMTHVIVAAFGIGLAENPRMNQFVVGRRMYKRNKRLITFSMKRKAKGRKAKLGAVKMEMIDGETFAEFIERVNAKIGHERSGEKTKDDKEFEILEVLPRPVLRFAVGLIKTLDYYNLLPRFWIDGDGMYTSIFVANLGSLGMGAGYHHLYEYGTCPLFIMVGKTEWRTVVEDGEIKAVPVVPLRFSYDERIDDGLNASYGIESTVRIIEDPFEWLGCVSDDGSDAGPMWPHGKEADVGEVVGDDDL